MDEILLFGAIGITYFFLRWKTNVAIGLIIGLATAQFQTVFQTHFLTVSGLMVYPVDVLYISVFIFIGPRILAWRRKRSRIPFVVLLFGAISFVGILRGLVGIGPSAIGESRWYVFPFLMFLMLWVSVDHKRPWDDLAVVLKIFAIVNLVSLIPHIISYIDKLFISGRTFSHWRQTRLLSAMGATAVALLFLYTVTLLVARTGHVRKKREVFIAVVTGMLLVLLQHRSVWAGTLVGLTTIMMVTGIKVTRVIQAGFIALLIMLTVLFIEGIQDENILADSLGQSIVFLEDVEEDKTANWRLIAWTSEISVGLESPIFGHGYGGYSEFSDPLSGEVVNTQAHNGYVMMFSKLGIVGLLIYASIFVQVVRTAKRSLHTSNLSHRAIYIWLIAAVAFNAVFAFFYYLSVLDWSIYAAILLLAKQEKLNAPNRTGKK